MLNSENKKFVYIKNGDIFKSKCDYLVNPVNCEGVSGAGLALLFKEKFPGNFKNYRYFCESGKLGIGGLLLYEENNKIIINFPTKNLWRNYSSYDYVDSGLHKLRAEIVHRKIKSIAIPALGCGLGGLHWDKVRKMIESHFKTINHDITIEIYEPRK